MSAHRPRADEHAPHFCSGVRRRVGRTAPNGSGAELPRVPQHGKKFLEDFAKGGSSAKAGIFSPGDLKRSTKFDSSLSDLTGVSLFDDPDDEETFQGVVAINTERGNTVTGQGQFKTVPTDVNYMDIDVRNIIVISINTARGGNAIATSEIFIEPIQKAS